MKCLAPGGCVTFQRGFDRWQKRANRNFMKFNQGKCKSCTQKGSTLRQKCVGMTQQWVLAAWRAAAKAAWPAAPERDSPPLHHSRETSPGALHPPLRSSVTEFYRTEVEKCHKKFCNVRETHNKILRDKVWCGDSGRKLTVLKAP